MNPEIKEPLFDVVAVEIDSSKVRILDENKTRDNAEAIVSMAVMRRGVEEEFFSATPHGTYKAGDKWSGDKCPPEPKREPRSIQTIDGMSYPIGPRGLH